MNTILSRFKREFSVGLVYLALLLILAVFAPRFYESSQMRDIFVQSAPVLVAAVGMTLVMLTRNIDISIGSQLSVCAVLAALLAQAGVPVPVTALAAIAAGAGLGALNGFFVVALGLPAIVVTLAMLVSLREGLRWWREGQHVRDLPPSFEWFGLGQDRGQECIVAIAVALFLLFAWGMRHLAAGRAVYATGSDPEAARLAGVRPRRVVFSVFVLMGGLCGLAGLLNAVRLPEVAPNTGEGLELQVIAAVVVGGVSVSGGRGSLVGPLLGVLLLGTVGSALVFLKADAHWQKAIQGGIILLAVASDAFSIRRRDLLARNP